MDVAVGGVFLSAFLQVAFDRIGSSRKFIEFFHGKNEMTFDEDTLDRLEITLDTISVVLEDAENKQLKSPAIRRWIDKLKDAVIQADDLLDEFNTECLRIKADNEFRHEENQVGLNVSDTKIYLKSDFIEELMPNVKKITDRLEYFVKQIHVLGLQKFDDKEKGSYRVLDKSQTFGRDEEMEKLIQMVLSDEGGASDVSVIPITGMGGVGKTTLAQLVYNDDRVKNHFLTTAWVCVSEEYDALRVTKALLMEVNYAIVDHKDDFNHMQVKLRDSLAGKRFLVILDDVWNENYHDWHSLKNPLNYGKRGSKIVITTRNEKIALMMQNEPFHHMQPILEDQSWCLFKTHAFDNGDHTPSQEFEAIGREIVKKCKGLPLAIKTIAGALRPKRDTKKWHGILSSEVWSTETDILPALSLSYKHLPSHLKCCFAFCAIFPKAIPFDKDEVVLLWMANDLVQHSNHKSLQEIGQDYFEELRSRYLIEMVDGNKYLMHDLVNDFTRYISRNFCARLQDYQDTDFRQGAQRKTEIPREVLHFSYLATYADISRRFKALAEVHSLRTFLSIHVRPSKITTLFFSDILPRFRRIRALCLSGYDILVIPDSIGELKHLRFLNLAATNIRKLPNAIGKCLNLQTLMLKNCKNLEELPKDMRRLINLQHLDVRGVGNTLIGRMASWLKQLENIQNLSIVIDKIHGSVLGQLNKLQPFRLLKITGLETVVKFESAMKFRLNDNDRIDNLILKWTGMAECSDDELNIFSKMQPHNRTKRLTIKGYRGTTFSGWLGDSTFSNMVSLYLHDCNNCFLLPPLGQLTALKKLQISSMDKIIVVGEEFYGNASTSKHFQSLEELSFSKMAGWTTWNRHPDGVEFSSLKQFSITDCPKLVGEIPFDVTCLKKVELRGLTSLLYNQTSSFPYSQSLQIVKISDFLNLKKMPEGISHLDKMEVCRCPELVSIPNDVDKLEIIDCPSLSLSLRSSVTKQLVIGQCKHLEFPTSDSCNSSLEILVIENCGDSIEEIPLCSFSKLREGPSSLESLYVIECEKLMICPRNWGLQSLWSLRELYIWRVNDTLFPEEGLLPCSLQHLSIWDFPNLEALNVSGLQHLCSLKSLSIEDCPNLESFLEDGLTPTLSLLEISNCPKLKTSIKREKGEDWPKVSRVPVIYIEDLNIFEYRNAVALNRKGLQRLFSPQFPSLENVPNLESFAEDGLTSSVSGLHITSSTKLNARTKREKGEDWPKVSHIPIMYVDDELIS